MGKMTEPRIRVAAVIVRDGQLLLIRHEKNGESYWLLPGGGVEFGESLMKALERELIEETKLEIQVRNLLYLNDSIAPDGTRHIVNLYFCATIEGGDPILGDDPRTVELRFVGPDELKELLVYPNIKGDLLTGLRKGFPERACYLDVEWQD
jgi:ADP-ribose pyrophosphatase YjhB (NUDIX family)